MIGAPAWPLPVIAKIQPRRAVPNAFPQRSAFFVRQRDSCVVDSACSGIVSAICICLRMHQRRGLADLVRISECEVYVR